MEPNPEQKKVIYIAEDRKDIRVLYEAILGNLNFNLIMFEDGQKIYDALVEDIARPSALFTDFNMPGKNGLEVVRKLREDERSGIRPYITPIAMVTANPEAHNSNSEIGRELRQLGVNYFIEKPFRPAIIIATAKEMLDL